MGKCSGITRSGERCRSIAITGSDYCHAHHPDRDEQRRRAARKGGKRAGRGRPVVEVAEIQQRLEDLAGEVLDGAVETHKASAAGQLLNFALRAISVRLKAREQEELIELELVEERLEQRGQGRRGWG